ncbi:Transcriptional regulator sterile apetala, partial [Thalictrum thalictroides]
VCTTWQSVSRSDHLWRNLTRTIWHRHHLLHDTWQSEYHYRHRICSNFRTRRALHTNLVIIPTTQQYANVGDNQNFLTCRRLAISDYHLACGLVDGSIRLFDLITRIHVTTFLPQQREHLGLYARAVSGIVLTENQLVFGSLDGDLHVAVIGNAGGVDNLNNPNPNPRRVQLGNVVTDGTLVDFTGCCRWWVGLYAGVPGQSFHVWNAETEQLVFIGGSLTDPESVMGWHLLTEFIDSIGRVRIIMSSNQESVVVVASTAVRLMSLEIRNDDGMMIVLNEEQLMPVERRLIVDSVDVNSNTHRLMIVDNRRFARIRRVGVGDFEEVCRFRIRRGGGGRLMGCINGGCVFIWNGGMIRTWDARQGEFLYNLMDRIGEVTALIADDRHVACTCADGTIHLWDFGAI